MKRALTTLASFILAIPLCASLLFPCVYLRLQQLRILPELEFVPDVISHLFTPGLLEPKEAC